MSESGPNHGLSSAHDTSFGNVFASEENEVDDEDEALENEEGDSEKRSEGKSIDDVDSEENTKIDDEDSMLLENGSEKTPKFRGRRESHV